MVPGVMFDFFHDMIYRFRSCKIGTFDRPISWWQLGWAGGIKMLHQTLYSSGFVLILDGHSLVIVGMVLILIFFRVRIHLRKIFQ
jgi:hypothetical protein